MVIDYDRGSGTVINTLLRETGLTLPTENNGTFREATPLDETRSRLQQSSGPVQDSFYRLKLFLTKMLAIEL